MGSLVNRFDLILKQLKAAGEAEDYKSIAQLDRKFVHELSTMDMNEIASNPAQLEQLKALLQWYSATISEFTNQKNKLRAELNGRAKNKSAVGSYQQVAFGAAL